VQGGGVNVVLDLGPGTLANLQQHIGLDEIDAVVLSHSHPDHWIDLTGLETAWTYALERTGLPVYGTHQTLEKASCVIGDLAPTLDWTDLDDARSIKVGGLELSFSPTEHYVPTLAVRVAGDGTSLAYSADTGPGWAFSEFGRSIDLALCEATNLEQDEGDGVLHLSARQAGAMARASGVGRLVLTHFLPGADLAAYRAEGEAAFGSALELASIHATYEV
jgi:ribonuclease BN (tRNA processing enzyme)